MNRSTPGSGDMERLLARIHATAQIYADRNGLVSLPEARMVVLAICREEQLRRPPADLLETLANELVRLSLELQDDRMSQGRV